MAVIGIMDVLEGSINESPFYKFKKTLFKNSKEPKFVHGNNNQFRRVPFLISNITDPTFNSIDEGDNFFYMMCTKKLSHDELMKLLIWGEHQDLTLVGQLCSKKESLEEKFITLVNYHCDEFQSLDSINALTTLTSRKLEAELADIRNCQSCLSVRESRLFHSVKSLLENTFCLIKRSDPALKKTHLSKFIQNGSTSQHIGKTSFKNLRAHRERQNETIHNMVLEAMTITFNIEEEQHTLLVVHSVSMDYTDIITEISNEKEDPGNFVDSSKCFDLHIADLLYIQHVQRRIPIIRKKLDDMAKRLNSIDLNTQQPY